MFDIIHSIFACIILLLFAIFWLIHCIKEDKYKKLQEQLYNERYFDILEEISDSLSYIENLHGELKITNTILQGISENIDMIERHVNDLKKD